MHNIISNTWVDVTEFTYIKVDRDGVPWLYCFNASEVTGFWSVYRREPDKTRIPPFIQVLCDASKTDRQPGCFFPVVVDHPDEHQFVNPEDAVQYVKSNY